MSAARGLGWSSRQIRNGPQRLASLRPAGVRHYSLNTYHSSLTRLRSSRTSAPTRQCLAQQSRSISLFGWGSSKSSSDPAASSLSQETGNAAQNLIEPTRTVKASQATADTPDPTFTHPHPVSSVEPEALRKLENELLKPHGTTPSPEVAADVPDLSSIPEDIGYLKTVCGLDFGWGPTSILEFCLEHLHITAGLTWTTSIIALAFLIRGAVFLPAVNAADQGSRLKMVQPATMELRERMQEALRNNNRTVAMEAQQQLREIHKEAGVSMWKAFLPVILQMPLQFCAFRLLRDAAAVPVPAFESEKFLWITDISVADPMYLLPLGTAVLTYFNMTASSKQQANPPPLFKLFQTFAPPLSFIFLSFQSSAVQVFFLVNGFFSQIQISTINNPAFRRWKGMMPLVSTPPSPSSSTNDKFSGPFSKMNIAATNPSQASKGLSTEQSAPGGDRSIIDKGVDAGKAAWTKTVGGISETWKEEARKRQEKAKVDQRKTAAAKYEAQRKLDLEQERLYRNAAAGSVRVNKNSASPLASTTSKQRDGQ
ncbi:hypothetical protein PV08_09323 [Exophiala spinifera]|uniref:Membrane insertase YidC/Oxa/ALB C-terminal domain-containing protein n=1 Tax=Exophiala spinifera TaxID=91928 RepID=A0A0D2BLK7_9EURO|nr:uncharacterized protein PV08_09323 [Exophiala spinifera]KIW12049.1 hypothetical protein PV08_09323 [Exophiala spinifera]